MLAIKYRPKNLDEVVGHNELKIILNNQIKENKIKHAYLFYGYTGCGKTTLARIFAKSVNDGEESEIYELDCASNNGVDDIRKIIDNSRRKPVISKYKIFILDECHQITSSAAASLLKLLEEPCETTIFILCTTNPEKVIPTIKNRCQTFYFRKLTLNEITNQLDNIAKQENILFTGSKEYILSSIATKAKGSMRQALQYLEQCSEYMNPIDDKVVLQCLGVIEQQIYDKFLWAFTCKNVQLLLQIIDEFVSYGNDIKNFLQGLNEYVIDCIKYKLSQNVAYLSCTKDEKFVETCDQIKMPMLQELLSFLVNCKESLQYETQPVQMLENLILLYGGNNNGK